VKTRGEPAAGRAAATRREALRGARRAARASSPRGRDAVRTALLDAAATLFAERGPAAVSVRDVAAAAGVNHGLVHRHFGSKEALVAGVLERMAHEIALAVPARGLDAAAVEELFGAAARRPGYWRILAWAILSGERPSALQAEFPTVRRLVDAVRRGYGSAALAPGFDPAVVAGASVALVLGWLLFEPFLLEATGLARRGAARARAAVVEHLALLGARLESDDASHGSARARRRPSRPDKESE
jgi:AcrR family transcriptional regulator